MANKPVVDEIKLPGTLAFTEACQRVIRAAEKNPGSADMQYAAIYARRGVPMKNRTEIAIQSNYILSNLSYWKGEEAKTVKAQLREFAAFGKRKK